MQSLRLPTTFNQSRSASAHQVDARPQYVTVGGPEAQVAGDIETIRSKGGEIGLHLTNKKCCSFAKMDVRAIQFSSPSSTWKRLTPLFYERL